MLSVYGSGRNQRLLQRRRFFWQILGLILGFVLSLLGIQAAPLASAASPAAIPNDPLWDRQWYLRQVKADEAWAVTTGTPAVVVAIIDVGVDITHPDLRDVIWTNPGEVAGDQIDNDRNGFIDDVQGWNFVNNTADVRPVYTPTQSQDAWSHGTMVASLIGAKGNDGIGMVGMAWNVRLMPLIALGGDGSGSTQDIIQAIEYAIRKEAKVINLSLAGYEEDPALTTIIHRAAQAGIVVVAANGNSNSDSRGTNIDDIPSYPACGEKDEDAIIGVGGTNASDKKAVYANFGARCTDISAPAANLFAARPSYTDDPSADSPRIPLYRERVGGTSLAAPLVTGAVALLRSVHPDWTVRQIQERLYTTADALSLDQVTGTKTVLGYGRLNVARALAHEPSSAVAVVSRDVPASVPLLPIAPKKIVVPRHTLALLSSLRRLVLALN